MERKRIAIACQGGGSQCAFVAGALRTLLARRTQDRFNVVGLSGTSGGALTAAVAWLGLLAQARGKAGTPEDRISAFWKELTAQTPQEIFLDHAALNLLRLTEQGVLPSFAISPSSMRFTSWLRAVGLITRPEFTDLRLLLGKHIDFHEASALVEPQSPVLLLGAADVTAGSFKIFSSATGDVSIDALLASAAIPNLFPAVCVDGHAYWDGIFASNPPVLGFLSKDLMGAQELPDEIWILQVNRPENDFIPERPADISDRRNQLGGNLSLQHELLMIRIVNLLLSEGALSDTFRARFGLDMCEGITVRVIRMSESLAHGLDYPSKLSRQPDYIARLLADGDGQANAFLDRLEATAPERSIETNGRHEHAGVH